MQVLKSGHYMTISQVTKAFHVTTRMLRYYDQIGLLPSRRMEGYAYRVYDEEAVRRLQQILTLRKLRIPLAQIARIFESSRSRELVDILQENVSELDGEIEALQTIREILRGFVLRLNAAARTDVHLDLLDDAALQSVIQTLSLSKTKLKEERSMDSLNKASEALSTLKNVRIVHLPPCTVAASHYFGENPEDTAGKQLDDFVRAAGLHNIKPDLRLLGFNNPTPTGGEAYGYEFWVTIPDDFDVPAPLEKKRFAGGLYAAHCIKMGDFQEWQMLGRWVEESGEYDYDPREPQGMGGCLEEHLNAYSYFAGEEKAAEFVQLDLLSPIKPK